MRLIAVEEKRLDQLVDAMLDRLKPDGNQHSHDTKTLSYSKVNYEVRCLISELKERVL